VDEVTLGAPAIEGYKDEPSRIGILFELDLDASAVAKLRR
jgi:hypothetical protein